MHRGLGPRGWNQPNNGTGNNFQNNGPPPNTTFVSSSQRVTNIFVGSISAGITDAFLNQLLTACGPIKSFKRLITPANKPQGFGFAEFDDPDGALRAISLLHGVELPSLEEGTPGKTLLVKADDKTKTLLDVYQSQRMKTSSDDTQFEKSRTTVAELVENITKQSKEAATTGPGKDAEGYVIPPHLHDLQEADLPETQRGLVISEIAQFRERAAKRERDKARDNQQQQMMQGGAPSGPKAREWGRPQPGQEPQPQGEGFGRGAQGYSKPVGFVRSEEAGGGSAGMEPKGGAKGKPFKSDEEMEEERRDARKREEETSFRDRERRYEPRERARIQTLMRSIAREEATKEAEGRDRDEIKSRLDVWDDDESDEAFYIDRAQWRRSRRRRLEAEEYADAQARVFEEREADNLRQESDAFLAKQMDDMQSLAEEQRKAGLLLDDGAPVRLNVAPITMKDMKETKTAGPTVFGPDDDEDDPAKKRKAPLVKLDFSATEDAEKTKERLENIRKAVPKDRETLFKAKVRWDGVSEAMIDRKLEPLIKRLMITYLGELEDDDLIMFVLEHLKDHKGPQKLVEGLEPVLEEDAQELAIALWRQIIFESIAYGDGLHTEKMMVD